MTMRRMLCAAVLAAAAGLGGCEAIGRAGPPRVGRPAPEYEARTLDGAPISLAGLRGQTVLLNVWATWCHPCRTEMPDLQRLHQANAGRGLRLVGVTVDEPGMEGEIREFLRDFGVTYEIWMDDTNHVASTFAAVGVPVTFLVGKDGTLLWKHVGPLKSDDPELNRLLDQALAGS